MSTQITQAQLDSVLQFRVKAYANGIDVGVFEEGEISVKAPNNIDLKGSNTTGGSGAFMAVRKGTNPVITFTNLLEYNKAKFLNAFSMLKAGTTLTGTTTPSTGTLMLTSIPAVVAPITLVLYPMVIDMNGVEYTDTNTNPYTILIPRAVNTGDFTMSFNSDGLATYTLEFTGLVDNVTYNNVSMIIDDGITSVGVYTP